MESGKEGSGEDHGQARDGGRSGDPILNEAVPGTKKEMNSWVIVVYEDRLPDVLWTYVIDERPETWLPREKGEGWTLQMASKIKDQVQRRWFEHWDGTAKRRVQTPPT